MLGTDWQTQVRNEVEAEFRRRQSDRRGGRKIRRNYDEYPYDPAKYIQEWLGWTPWSGSPDRPGQGEVLDAYVRVLRQLHEKDGWEKGYYKESDLTYWRPGEIIRNRIRVEAGHTVGKTKTAAGIVSHFFDNFKPAIVYTFAPSWSQINDLLWKEIRVDRRGSKLPGRVLDTPEIKYKANHFAKGKATSDASGAGIERAQGQHGKYLLFVLDEAVGIPGFIWRAVDTMTSGGITVVLMLANPRTRLGRFYKERENPYTTSFRISCLNHPNVALGREVVPGAVRRDWVEFMVETHCNAVTEHDPDRFTFELPWRPETIYEPDNDFLYQVLGIAPKHSADDTFVPVGRYEAACKRDPLDEPDNFAFFGVDAARYGSDYGTLYVRHGGKLQRAAQLKKQDTFAYYSVIRDVALALPDKVKTLHIRVDGTGGFGAGVVDLLKVDADLKFKFDDYRVLEIHFGSSPHDTAAYRNIITEMYAEAAETLKGIAIHDPPEELEGDLTERKYKTINYGGRAVKALEDKEGFKKRIGRSPDDGDGFVLAAAPAHIFDRPEEEMATSRPRIVRAEDIFK